MVKNEDTEENKNVIAVFSTAEALSTFAFFVRGACDDGDDDRT